MDLNTNSIKLVVVIIIIAVVVYSAAMTIMVTYCELTWWLQYAERLPIGLEKVIRTVSSDTVKQFYQKWYHLHNMAVIAVGDFTDTQVWID